MSRPKHSLDLTDVDLFLWAAVCARLKDPDCHTAEAALKADAIDAGVMCWAQHWRADGVTMPIWCKSDIAEHTDCGGNVGHVFDLATGDRVL